MSQTSASLLHHLLRRLDGGDVAALFELVVDERLEQLERHDLGQTTLVQLELRTDDDDRTAGVVDALAEQVLTETALLALEHVAERLERALVGTGDGLAATTVVEERVDRLLQHALLVADDDLRRVELLEALEAVVSVDDATVEVVEIRRREAATVEGNERAQVRRNDRTTSSIIHSGLLLELRKPPRLSAAWRSSCAWLRRSPRGLPHLLSARAPWAVATRVSSSPRSSRMASAPMPARERVAPVVERFW
jgi:hypothetical protein